MLIFKNKISILNIILEILALAMFALFIYLALSYPLAYIGVVVLCIVLFCMLHKSNFIILKQDGIIYRKYFIWKKLRFDKIASIYIVKHSFSTRTGIFDFHNKKDRKVQGCIFFAKADPCLPKDSLNNSIKLSVEWSNFYFDVQYNNQIIRNMITGGFNGDIFITAEMAEVMGKDLEKLLSENNFDCFHLKVVDLRGN